LHARAPANNAVYNYNFNIAEINLGQPGDYEVSYYVFYACASTTCDRGESIRVQLNDEPEVIHSYEELRDNLPWVRKTIRFSSAETTLNVCFYR
jgi:hypothetical protein